MLFRNHNILTYMQTHWHLDLEPITTIFGVCNSTEWVVNGQFLSVSLVFVRKIWWVSRSLECPHWIYFHSVEINLSGFISLQITNHFGSSSQKNFCHVTKEQQGQGRNSYISLPTPTIIMFCDNSKRLLSRVISNRWKWFKGIWITHNFLTFLKDRIVCECMLKQSL